MTLEETVNEKVAKLWSLLGYGQRKRERERTFKVTIAKYLAFDVFQVVKDGCFFYGFEAFQDMAAEAFLNHEFSTFFPDEDEEGKEERREEREKKEWSKKLGLLPLRMPPREMLTPKHDCNLLFIFSFFFFVTFFLYE